MEDNEQVVALPDTVFVQVLLTSVLNTLIHQWQQVYSWQIEEWYIANKLERKRDQAWYRDWVLVVVGEDSDKKALLELYYNSPTMGHSRQDKMLRVLSQDYWWPGMRTFVHEYVKGCAHCQESKPITHSNTPSIQPIHPQSPTRPFSTIAMDFIVKLPVSQGYNSVLTIIDHNCTKLVISLPCKEEMDLLSIVTAQLRSCLAVELSHF